MSETEHDTEAAEGEPIPAAPEGRYNCPECGKKLANSGSLARHRKNKHGVRAAKSGGGGKPRGGGPSGSRQERRARLIRETLDEATTFTDELRGRATGEPQDLADVIRRDASRIAESVAWAAERLAPVGWLIDRTMGHGGVISIARGFTGVGSWTARRWRTMLGERQRQQELEQQEREQAGGDDGDGTGTGDGAPFPLA